MSASKICKMEKAYVDRRENMKAVCVEPGKTKTLAEAPKMKEVKDSKFEAKPKQAEFRFMINKNAKFSDQIYGASQVRKTNLTVANQKGELVAVNTLEAKGEKGMRYLQRNQVMMGLKMVELEGGKRVFVTSDHAKNFKMVSIEQQRMELLGAIGRKQDKDGVYYEPRHPVGQKFLAERPELPQRN